MSDDIAARIEELQSQIGGAYAGLSEEPCPMSAHIGIAELFDELAFLHCRAGEADSAGHAMSLGAGQLVLAMTLHAHLVAASRDRGEEGPVNSPVWYTTYTRAVEMAYLGSDLPLFASVVWQCPSVYQPTNPADVDEDGEKSAANMRMFFRGEHQQLASVDARSVFVALNRGDEAAFLKCLNFHLKWASENEGSEFSRFPTMLAKLARQYAPQFRLPREDDRIAWLLVDPE